MKLLQKNKTKKKKIKTLIPKSGLFSYSSYLQQRKIVPYELSYRSFIQYCIKAKHYPGKQLNNILMLIEHRLDVAIYRIGFCRTILEARQLINHNKIVVNENPMTLSSYHLKPGDIIQIKSGYNIFSPNFLIIKKMPCFHFEVNFMTATAIFLYPPQKLYFSNYLNFDLIRRGLKRTF